MSGPSGPPPPPPPPADATVPPGGGGRPPRVGEVVGHYRVDSVLGVGGMGMVFSATDLRLQRQVALKVMLGHVGASPDFQRRFQREASVLARLDSPHVVAIYDHGEQGGWPYIVTQYAAGGDLSRLLRNGGPLPPPMAFRVCSQVADALSAAHAVGVVHRDVKPANVLLRDERTDRLHVYLCDFGVAHTEGATGLTTAGAVAGTWNYLPPERATGQPGGPAGDVYAVGCLLYECLTGRPPYSGSDVTVAMAHLQQPVPQLPGTDDLTVRINQVLAGALAKDPADRYPSARALRDALRELGGGLTPSTPTSPPLVLGQRRRRRRLVVAGGLGAALLLGGVATGVVLASGGDDDPDPDPGTTATSDPTGSTTGSPVPDPAPELVTGDLDGDGLGDVATVSYDGAWLMRSDGRGFGAPTALKGLAHPVVTGDVDGDGRLDTVTVGGEMPSLQATTRLADGTEQSSLVRVQGSADSIINEVPFVADVDGDGRADFGFVTAGEGKLIVTVARAREDGTFAQGRRWLDATGPSDALGNGQAGVGDMDGDGLADLVYVQEGEDVPTLRVLGSTGEAFEERASQPVSDDYSYRSWRMGDFDGDGTDDLVTVMSGPRLDVWSWDGTRLTPKRWIDLLQQNTWTDETSAVMDVDGDGDDDVAMIFYDEGLQVLESTGSSFRLLPGRRIIADPKKDRGLIGPIVYD